LAAGEILATESEHASREGGTMKTTKRVLVATVMAATILVGPLGLVEAVHAAPIRPVESGPAWGNSAFDMNKCGRYASAINQHINEANNLNAQGLHNSAAKEVKQAQDTQDQAMDNGCFIVNPV
jgi:hypothetical protein